MVSPATALLLQAAAYMSLSRATAISGLTNNQHTAATSTGDAQSAVVVVLLLPCIGPS